MGSRFMTMSLVLFSCFELLTASLTHVSNSNVAATACYVAGESPKTVALLCLVVVACQSACWVTLPVCVVAAECAWPPYTSSVCGHKRWWNKTLNVTPGRTLLRRFKLVLYMCSGKKKMKKNLIFCSSKKIMSQFWDMISWKNISWNCQQTKHDLPDVTWNIFALLQSNECDILLIPTFVRHVNGVLPLHIDTFVTLLLNRDRNSLIYKVGLFLLERPACWRGPVGKMGLTPVRRSPGSKHKLLLSTLSSKLRIRVTCAGVMWNTFWDIVTSTLAVHSNSLDTTLPFSPPHFPFFPSPCFPFSMLLMLLKWNGKLWPPLDRYLTPPGKGLLTPTVVRLKTNEQILMTFVLKMTIVPHYQHFLKDVQLTPHYSWSVKTGMLYLE